MSFFDIIPEYVATKRFVMTEANQRVVVAENLNIYDVSSKTIFEFIAPISGSLRIEISFPLASRGIRIEWDTENGITGTELSSSPQVIILNVSANKTYGIRLVNIPENKNVVINKIEVLTTVLDDLSFYIANIQED